MPSLRWSIFWQISVSELEALPVMQNVELERFPCHLQVGADEGPGEPYTCLQFHPDGLILGTGTEGKAIR